VKPCNLTTGITLTRNPLCVPERRKGKQFLSNSVNRILWRKITCMWSEMTIDSSGHWIFLYSWLFVFFSKYIPHPLLLQYVYYGSCCLVSSCLCVVCCRSLFVLLFFFFWPLCCMSFFDFTDSDYFYVIFKFFFQNITAIPFKIEMIIFP